MDWQAILEQEGPVVWRTAYRLLGDPVEAEECFQETFLAALQLARRQPVQSWRALLQRVATTRAVDRLRQRCRRRSREEVADCDRFLSPEPPPSQAAEY